jgi:hypothetical protein
MLAVLQLRQTQNVARWLGSCGSAAARLDEQLIAEQSAFSFVDVN